MSASVFEADGSSSRPRLSTAWRATSTSRLDRIRSNSNGIGFWSDMRPIVSAACRRVSPTRCDFAMRTSSLSALEVLLIDVVVRILGVVSTPLVGRAGGDFLSTARPSRRRRGPGSTAARPTPPASARHPEHGFAPVRSAGCRAGHARRSGSMESRAPRWSRYATGWETSDLAQPSGVSRSRPQSPSERRV